MERLLAVGSLMLVLLLNFNALRADTGVGQSLIGEEVESLGGDLLQSTFDELAALPFDRVSAPTTPNDLTPKAQFGGATWELAADLDDLDGATVTRKMQGAGGPGTLDFNLAATVSYVQKSGTTWADSSARTYFKRVTVTATGPEGFHATVESVFAAKGV